MSSSSPRPVEPRWKTLLAVLSLVLATAIWVTGLIDSLSRPSVAPVLTLQQQELSVLAEPAVPSALRPVLMGEAPRQVLLQALQDSPESRRSSRQTQLLKLLQGSGDADIAAARASDDPLLQLLWLQADPPPSWTGLLPLMLRRGTEKLPSRAGGRPPAFCIRQNNTN